MPREKKTVVVGRRLQALLAKVGTQRSQLESGLIFMELRVPLYDLAMALAVEDDELLEDVLEQIDDVESELCLDE